MRRAAFIMLTAAALALAGCGGAEQDAAQKARRAAVEAETAAQDALIKAAPAEWKAYQKNRLNVTWKGFQSVEFPDGGYEYEEEKVVYDRTGNAFIENIVIEAAPTEWDAYIAAHNAANIARDAVWNALQNAERDLQYAASDEWKAWAAAVKADRAAKAANGGAAKAANKALKAAETALKQAAPEQWKTYKAAVSEVENLEQR